MTGPSDLDLLRRHEPILRFTDGELFFPMAAGSYVESCDLLTGPSLREARVAIPAGELNLERLAAVGDPPLGEAQFLRFVPKPLSRTRASALAEPPGAPALLRPGPARPGRSRRPSRGRRPRHLAAVARPRPRRHGGRGLRALRRDPGSGTRSVVYHGRVVREGRWVVLHYMFFYAMNDWRSTFEGANDHEADLEQCFVVLEALDDGTLRPAWFCAAAHDEKGDDLRRRWDDARMEIVDGHPVVYPGAGSHATYLERGEYIMLLPFPGERNIRGPLDLLRRFWRDTLAQPDPGDLAATGAASAERPLRRLRPRRRPGRRARRRRGVDADDRQRRGRLDRPLPRPLGSRHRRPVRGRASPGRAEVHPNRLRPPVVARSARVRGSGQDRAAVAGHPRARGADRRADGRPGDGDGGGRGPRVSLPALDAEMGAVRGAAGLDSYRAALALELQTGEERLTSLRSPGGGARHGDRRRARPGDRAAGRVSRRSAAASAPRVRA